jgi:hypothetical protein
MNFKNTVKRWPGTHSQTGFKLLDSVLVGRQTWRHAFVIENSLQFPGNHLILEFVSGLFWLIGVCSVSMLNKNKGAIKVIDTFVPWSAHMQTICVGLWPQCEMGMAITTIYGRCGLSCFVSWEWPSAIYGSAVVLPTSLMGMAILTRYGRLELSRQSCWSTWVAVSQVGRLESTVELVTWLPTWPSSPAKNGHLLQVNTQEEPWIAHPFLPLGCAFLLFIMEWIDKCMSGKAKQLSWECKMVLEAIINGL